MKTENSFLGYPIFGGGAGLVIGWGGVAGIGT